VRYIGNKTRLLEFINEALVDRRIDAQAATPPLAVDPFCGTASVASALKRLGFRVVAADIMEYARVFAHAYVQVSSEPDLTCLAATLRLPDATLATVVDHVNALPARPGFIHDHYSPAGREGGVHGRMYFTPENAARIDGIRQAIHEWRDSGWIDDDAAFTLLAALLEAADRVANTTGVYAAFVKSWQPNSTRPLTLRIPDLVAGEGSIARRVDAIQAATEAGPFHLLYLDPPYNNRQYAGYYHVPEIIARGWFDGRVRTRGKTGLIDDQDKRSDWSRRQRCETVFEQLVSTTGWTHLVMSYNAEGIIPESVIERVLRENGRSSTYERKSLSYKRYRSDADGENRRYRGDTVTEYLYCVSR
jgi:adenine-specific DNA-methyltransferase